MDPSSYLPRSLPESLQGLIELALDLRWSWSHSADDLWQTISPELWAATANPWLILSSVSERRLRELAQDRRFSEELGQELKNRREYMAQTTWFRETHPGRSPGAFAYFSMEFGLSEALPIYSGGLGILAGDHLKAASDLGVPLVAVGLLYQQGYFRQSLDSAGRQLDFHPFNDPTMLPIVPLRDPKGEWLRIPVELPGRALILRCWEARVGRVLLYLLDSNDPLNAPGDRGITGELYGGGQEMRLQQELALGIGGWRLLDALQVDCTVCHLNEGHAAFAVLERARSFMQKTGVSFDVALCSTRAGNIFTTHTPVAAGFDRFAPELLNQYLGGYAKRLGIGMEDLLDLGRASTRDRSALFNMAYLASRGCGRINAVSRLHAEVSRRIFQPLFPRWPECEVPVSFVTNAVHTPSWESAAADDLWTISSGKARWAWNIDTLAQDIRKLSDEALWAFRSLGRKTLVDAVHRRLVRQAEAHGAADSWEPVSALDPNVLTMGFARRFTAYKRPNLLLNDPERLIRLLTSPDRPVQLIVAGKAHPQDEEGKRLVEEWASFMCRREVGGKMVFIEDYDLAVAQELIQGVDLWINNPRRPMEASGTSGMKVLVNGGLNLSELDGWWAEAWSPAVGWAIGDGKAHDADPEWDRAEADQLLGLLEREIVPEFYDRDERGIPAAWVARMRESMASLTPRFSTNRMTREYTEEYYLPCEEAYRRRSADQGALGHQIQSWRETLASHWPGLHFGNLQVRQEQQTHVFRVQVYLGDLPADAVRVELYAEPREDEERAVWPMDRGEKLVGAVNGYLYEAAVPAERAAEEYTPRIVPRHPEAFVPLEENHSLWQR